MRQTNKLHNVYEKSDERHFKTRKQADPYKILRIIANKRFQVLMVVFYVGFELLVAITNKATGSFAFFATYYAIHVLFFYLYCLVILPAALGSLGYVYKPILLLVSAVSLHAFSLMLIQACFFSETGHFGDSFQWVYIVNSSYRVSQIFLVSFIIWGGMTVIKLILRQRTLENNYLYARINPHFLHNCLNMIHSTIDSVNSEAGQMITDLSTYSRAAMRELDLDGKTRVANELEMINTFIHITKLRMEKELFLDIKIALQESDGDKSIPPQILVPLIENLIKHGVVTDPERPAEVTIESRDGYLHFTSFNHKQQTESKFPSYKIGLSNVRQRLESIYGRKFELSISDTDISYYLSLTLPL